MFQESFKGVSKKIEGCSNGVLCGFQRCLKEVQWVFEESSKGVSRGFQRSFRVLLGRLRDVPRYHASRAFKEGIEFQENFNYRFQGCFKRKIEANALQELEEKN